MHTTDTGLPSREQIMRPIDTVGIQERAAFFNTRKTKGEAKLKALYQLVSLLDLTTLEGADTPGKVRDLCAKALRPLPDNFLWRHGPQKDFKTPPPVAAVCVYPNMVPIACRHLKGSSVQVAAVATAFPSGQLPLELKLQEVQKTIDLGAHEIDMVINRGQFLSGQWQQVFDEVVAVKKVCHNVCLKVILETGELGSYEAIGQASQLAMHAGADFIKTSTGKVTQNANLPVSLVMLKEILNFYRHTGKRVGLKPAGGVRTAKQALSYLYMLYEEGADEWMRPQLFRLGASSLLDDILRQICKQHEGAYYCPKTFA